MTLTQALAAGADVRRALALECHAGAGDPALQRRAQECRRRSCACAPTICWRPSSPIRPPVPRTSPGRFAFPITCWCARRIGNCLHEAMDLDGLLRGAARRSRAGAVRTVAIDTPEPSVVLSRDPQRQSVRLSRRCAARRAARARRAAAPDDARRRRWRGRARSARRSPKSPRNRGRSFATPTSCTTR